LHPAQCRRLTGQKFSRRHTAHHAQEHPQRQISLKEGKAFGRGLRAHAGSSNKSGPSAISQRFVPGKFRHAEIVARMKFGSGRVIVPCPRFHRKFAPLPSSTYALHKGIERLSFSQSVVIQMAEVGK
jgi:hypothetical protein